MWDGSCIIRSQEQSNHWNFVGRRNFQGVIRGRSFQGVIGGRLGQFYVINPDSVEDSSPGK